MVLFRICNKEKIKWDKMIAVPLCTIGLFLILQPPIIFSQDNNNGIKAVQLEGYWKNKTALDNISINTILEGISNNWLSKENSLNNQISVENMLTNQTSMENISTNQTSMENISTNQTSVMFTMLGYILAVFAGLLTSVQISVVKHYNDFFTTHNLLISLSWSYVTGTVLSLIPMLIWEDPVIPNMVKDILLVIAHVRTYVFIMPLHLYGSLLISGNLGSIIRTSELVVMLIAQYTILSNIHSGHRNWIDVVLRVTEKIAS